MALEYSLCISLHETCGEHTVENATVYGTPEEDRNEAAEYLLVAHITEESVEEFQEVDSSPVLTKLSYTVPSPSDGHYRYTILRIPIWDSGTSYIKEVLDSNDIITTYANLVYLAATNKVYKAITNHSNESPDGINGTTNWEEVTDLTAESIRDNTTIVSYVYNDIIDCRAKKCTKDELFKAVANGCGCNDLNQMLPYLKKQLLLSGAQSKNEDNKPEQAETILVQLNKLCSSC